MFSDQLQNGKKIILCIIPHYKSSYTKEKTKFEINISITNIRDNRTEILHAWTTKILYFNAKNVPGEQVVMLSKLNHPIIRLL